MKLNITKRKEVIKKLRSGYPSGKVRNELEKEGYDKTEIDTLFKIKKADMRSWYLVFGIIFCIAGVWIIMQYSRMGLLICGVFLLVLYFNENKKFE